MRLDARMATALLVGLMAPALADANDLVLTPLIPDGVDGKAQLAVHQLLASELEFQPEVSSLEELDSRPPALNDGCLAQPACLKGITTSAGGDRLITGRMSAAGGGFALDLLLFNADTSQIVRRKTFNVANDPTAMANSMTTILRELLTGEGPPPAAGTTGLAAAESFKEAEEDSFAFTPSPAPVAARATPPRAPLQDLDDLDDLSIDRRRGGAAAAPPPPPPPPPPEPEIDPSMITFGGTVDDITSEEIDQMIQFGPAPAAAPEPAPAYAPAPAPVQPAPMQPAPQAAPPPLVADLDGDTQGKSKKAPSRDRGASSGSGHDGAQILQITARGGYSKYFAFDFLTAGAEVAVPVAGGLHALVGLESYSVNRRLPVELQVQTNQISAWDTIFPVNVGAMYKVTGGVVQPYGGADVIFVQYYRDEIGADWAGGGRARVGADFMLAPNFGLNLNAAVGFWSGANWSLIDRGLRDAGVLPQISAGTVLAF